MHFHHVTKQKWCQPIKTQRSTETDPSGFGTEADTQQTTEKKKSRCYEERADLQIFTLCINLPVKVFKVHHRNNLNETKFVPLPNFWPRLFFIKFHFMFSCFCVPPAEDLKEQSMDLKVKTLDCVIILNLHCCILPLWIFLLSKMGVY